MTAINCETGLDILKSVPMDIVFLDMRMPGIVTAYADDEKIQKARDLGVSGIFRKELSFDSLEWVMEEALAGITPK